MAIAGANIPAWAGWGGLAKVATAAADYPAEGDVRDGVSYGTGTYAGTLELPAVGDVRDGTEFGAAGTEYEGTLVLPSESDVRLGVDYGAGGTEFEGTMTQVPSTAATDLERMREAYDATLLDSCKIGTLTETTTGTYKSSTFVYGAEISCGFKEYRKDESIDGAQAQVIDAVIRLPWNTAISNDDRIRMTKRYGEAITELDYAIVGAIVRGLQGVQVKVALAPGGSKR